MSNGLYNGFNPGLSNGMFDGLAGGLVNGLYENDKKIKRIPVKGYSLINDAQFYDLNDWTNVNSCTTSLANGILTLSGGAGAFSKLLANSGYGSTNMCEWIIECIWDVKSLSATTDFFGIGVQGDSSSFGAGAIQAGMLVSTGAIKGEPHIYKGAGSSILTGGTKLAFSLNDTIKYVFSRTGNTYTITIQNLTTNSAIISNTVTPLMTTTAGAEVNTGKFAMFTFSGIADIRSFSVRTNCYLNPKTVFVGDSKTEGFDASVFSNTYPNLTMAGFTSAYNIQAKVNSITQDVVNGIGEIKKQGGTYAVLCIGRNDISAGIATATWQANYKSIVASLVAAKYTVVHLLPLPEVTLVQTALTTFINANYPQELIVDASVAAGFNTGTMLGSDNIHPNDLGMAFIANQIRKKVPFIL